MDGFEQYGTDETDFSYPNGANHGNYLSTSSSGRYGGRSLYRTSSGEWADFRLLPLSVSSLPVFTYGTAVRMISTFGSSSIFAIGENDGYGEISVDGALQIRQSAPGARDMFLTNGIEQTPVYTPADPAVWHYVEIVYDETADGGNGRVDFYVDAALIGSIPINLPCIPRRQSGACSVNHPLFSSASTSVYFDDMYISDVAVPLGDCRVQTMVADADGTYEEWLPSNASPAAYTNINVTGSSSWDSNYVYSNTPGARSTFTSTEQLPDTAFEIKAVGIMSMVRQDDAGSRVWKMMAKDSTTEVESAGAPGATPLTANRMILDLTPSGGPWTFSELTNLEFGLKIES